MDRTVAILPTFGGADFEKNGAYQSILKLKILYLSIPTTNSSIILLDYFLSLFGSRRFLSPFLSRRYTNAVLLFFNTPGSKETRG